MNETFQLFLIILAIGLFVINGALLCLKIVAAVQYEGSLSQRMDRLQGRRTVWVIKWNALITLISLAYIIAYFMAS